MDTVWHLSAARDSDLCECLICGVQHRLDEVRFFTVLTTPDSEVKAAVCGKCVRETYDERGPYAVYHFRSVYLQKVGS